jgi:hypothetical protein
MKKSNIILICVAVLTVSWLLISGWMQANAYKIIASGNTCSYASVSGLENQKLLAKFKNIKISIADVKITPFLKITQSRPYRLSYSKSFKKALNSFVRNDTLYITINNASGDYGIINIFTNELKSVTFKASPFEYLEYKSSGYYTDISGFSGNTLSIYNNGPNQLSILNNTFKRINIKGDFDKNRIIDITNKTLCDSVDIDIDGQSGFLKLNNSHMIKPYNIKQWTSIKIPGSCLVTGDANVVSKIILKK